VPAAGGFRDGTARNDLLLSGRPARWPATAQTKSEMENEKAGVGFDKAGNAARGTGKATW